MSEGGDLEVLTLFFRLPLILPSQVPSTSEKFVASVASKDLDFIQGLTTIDKMSLFGDVSRIIFRVRTPISIIAAGQDDVMGSTKILWE